MVLMLPHTSWVTSVALYYFLSVACTGDTSCNDVLFFLHSALNERRPVRGSARRVSVETKLWLRERKLFDLDSAYWPDCATFQVRFDSFKRGSCFLCNSKRFLVFFVCFCFFTILIRSYTPLIGKTREVYSLVSLRPGSLDRARLSGK